MLLRGLVSIAVLVLMTGCGFLDQLTPGNSSISGESTIEPDVLLVPDYNGVIMSSKPPMLWYPSGEITGIWSPSLADVKNMEAALPSYLEGAGEDTFHGYRVWEELDTYYRQYGGVLIDNQPAIYTSYTCDAPWADWQHQWLIVIDGGSCYFQTLYDLTTGAFLQLVVNSRG